jgi:hypothetical protein
MTDATVTADQLTPGTVVTFTQDITFVTPSWADLTVGTHLVVGQPTPTGNHVRVLNTRTGRHDFLPVYAPWVLRLVRILGRPS